MASRAVRHAAALAKREQRLAEERESALAAQKKDQEQRYWKSEEAKKVQRARSAKNAERTAQIAAALESRGTPLDQDVPIEHGEAS